MHIRYFSIHHLNLPTTISTHLNPQLKLPSYTGAQESSPPQSNTYLAAIASLRRQATPDSMRPPCAPFTCPSYDPEDSFHCRRSPTMASSLSFRSLLNSSRTLRRKPPTSTPKSSVLPCTYRCTSVPRHLSMH